LQKKEDWFDIVFGFQIHRRWSAQATTMLKKGSHNHNNNQTKPKKQPNIKNKPTANPPKKPNTQKNPQQQ
jgi:hypothetical protein